MGSKSVITSSTPTTTLGVNANDTAVKVSATGVVTVQAVGDPKLIESTIAVDAGIAV